jgi:4-aminobutyrate aminotransferase
VKTLKRSKSKKLLERERKVIGSAGCPRPLLSPYSIVVESTRGSKIIDIDGNEYIDFCSQGAVAGTGYCHPKIVNVIKEQIEKTTALGMWCCSNESSIQLAEKLITITPGDFSKKVVYGHSGSDACDGLYKLILTGTKRQRIISFIGSYHGSTMGGMSLSGVRGLNRMLGFPNVVKIPYAYCYRCPLRLTYPECGIGCVDYIEDVVFPTICPPEDTSGLLIEPIISDGGEIVPPEGYLLRLKKLCERYDLLFIADEVKTGFGRTGKMFAVEDENIAPDIMVLGKSIASGLPLSAIVGPPEILDNFGAHAFTLTGHPVICAAALATIDIIEKENLTENAKKIGFMIKKRLEEMKDTHEIIGDVRGKGLIIGVELVRDGKTKQPAHKETLKVCYRAGELGLFLTNVGIYHNVLEITPPLVITYEEAERGLSILEHAIRDVEKGKVADGKIIPAHQTK